ncbi:hypothetical protein O5D80_005197 [Batrachochytrium dendrobatidis]|nr:hypothetical protein O5D80_005197 [Batrachochytrium dendrobatidis]
MQISLQGVGLSNTHVSKSQWAAPRSQSVILKSKNPVQRSIATKNIKNGQMDKTITSESPVIDTTVAAMPLPELPVQKNSSGSNLYSDESSNASVEELCINDTRPTELSDENSLELYKFNQAQMDSTEHFQQVLDSGSLDHYKYALEIEERRQALALRALDLQTALQKEIAVGSKHVAHKHYGWTSSAYNFSEDSPLLYPAESNWDIPTRDFENPDTIERLWQMHMNVQALDCNLESENVSKKLFDDMLFAMTRQDLEGIDPAIIETHYPWLSSKQSHQSDYFDYPLPIKSKSKRKRKQIVNQVSKIPTQSISQKRFQQYLAEQEAKIQYNLNNKFRAKPAPTSVLIPKYHHLASSNTTRTVRLREKQHLEKSEKSSECHKCNFNSSKVCICSPSGKLINEALQKYHNSQSKPVSVRTSIVPKVVETTIEDGKRRRERIQQCEKLAGLTSEHTFQPSITGHMPDFETIQKKFVKRLNLHKMSHSLTQPAPFLGLEQHELKQAQRIRNRLERLEKTQFEPHATKPTVLNKKAFKHVEAKSTHSLTLKINHLRMQNEAQQLIAEVKREEVQQKKEKHRAFAYKIRARLDQTLPNTTQTHFEIKRKQYIQDQKQRNREYQESIEEIGKRVSSRMCLFEKVAVDAAKRKALTDFQRTIKALEIDQPDILLKQ